MSACRFVATIVSSDAGRLIMRAVIASTSSLSQSTSGNSFETCSAISSHITIAWRCALLLVTTVRSLRGRDCASLNAKRMIRSTPARVMIETSVAASIGWPWWTRPPTPAYSPSEFSRTMTQFRSSGPAALQRRVDAGQDPRRPHVGVLVEALADLQAQPPQRDVVRDVRDRRPSRTGSRPCRATRRGRRPASSRRAGGSSRRPSRSSRTRSGSAWLAAASASSTSRPAGTTSLPMPSPGIVAMR